MLPYLGWASHSCMAASDECFMWLWVNQVHIETLPGASPSIKTSPRSCQAILVCLLLLTCVVVPQQSQYLAHLICSHYRVGSGCYLFPFRHPWAVYSTCTPLSSLPSTTYLFITDSPRNLLSWQTPEFYKGREADKKCVTLLSNGGHCQYEFSFAGSQNSGQFGYSTASKWESKKGREAFSLSLASLSLWA